MIKKINLALVGFICFAIEGVFAKNIMNVVNSTEHVFVLRLVMIYLVFLAFYGKRNFAIVLGAFLGLAYDIVNLEVLGIYFVLFPGIVYLATKFMLFFPENMSMVSTVSFLSVVLLEFTTFISFQLIGLTQISFATFVETRLLFTMLLNFVMILIFSYPFAKISSKWGYSEF